MESVVGTELAKLRYRVFLHEADWSKLVAAVGKRNKVYPVHVLDSLLDSDPGLKVEFVRLLARQVWG